MEQIDNSLFEPDQRGVFGQIEYRMSLPEGHELRTVDLGGGHEVTFEIALFLIIAFMVLGVSGKSAQFPLLSLVARCDGRPHPGQCVDACGHDGDGGCLLAGTV